MCAVFCHCEAIVEVFRGRVNSCLKSVLTTSSGAEGTLRELPEERTAGRDVLRGIQRITVLTKEPLLEFMFASEDVPPGHTHFVAGFDRLLHDVSLVAC